MLRSAVTISLVEEARGGPFVFWHDLPAAGRRAAELGFDAVEVFPPSAAAVADSPLKSLLSEHKLKLAAVGTGAGWVKHKLTLTSGDPAVRAKARDFVKGIIDAAGGFGAPAIIGSMQGRHGDGVIRDDAQVYLLDALDELGAYALKHGVPLLYEFLNRYETNIATTVEAAMTYVSRVRNVKLLCDLFHMNIEEANLADALRTAGPAVGHIHFVDSNRRPAGLGHIDYAPIVAALNEIDYAGYLSAEAFPYPDSDAAAVQTIQTFRTFSPPGRVN